MWPCALSVITCAQAWIVIVAIVSACARPCTLLVHLERLRTLGHCSTRYVHKTFPKIEHFLFTILELSLITWHAQFWKILRTTVHIAMQVYDLFPYLGKDLHTHLHPLNYLIVNRTACNHTQIILIMISHHILPDIYIFPSVI